MEKRGLTPDAILLTHAHADHLRGLWHLYEKTGACVYIHTRELDARINIGPFRFVPPPKTHFIREGSAICAGSLRFSVLECPGHTPGSVAYRCEDTLFTGDTLLHMGSGRVDYPCSSREDMIASLSRLCGLSGDYRITPDTEKKRRWAMNVRTIPLCCPAPDILILATSGKKSCYKKKPRLPRTKAAGAGFRFLWILPLFICRGERYSIRANLEKERFAWTDR